MNKQIAELESKLVTADIRQKIDAHNALAQALMHVDPKRALDLSQTAYILAQQSTPDTDSHPKGGNYFKRITDSLNNLGIANQRLGNHYLALTQFSEVLTWYEEFGTLDEQAIVLRQIGSVYESLDNYLSALDYTLKALRLHQDSGVKKDEVDTLNNLGVIYNRLGDYEQELAIYYKAEQLIQELGLKEQKAINLNNIAMAHYTLGNFAEALAQGQIGLHLAQELGMTALEACLHCTIADIYVSTVETQKALSHFQQSISLAQHLLLKDIEMFALLGTGQTYLKGLQHHLGLSYLHQALQIAEELQEKVNLINCYQALAQAYKQQGDFETALTYYELFHALNEDILYEKANQRLENLKIIHETQTAQKEAEIYRLKTVELEQQIAERNRAEAALQQARDELETRVQARTAELSQANANLKVEIAQRKQIEEQYYQAQKMEALGQLTGGIAHDFNNILQIIIGYSELAKIHLPDHTLIPVFIDNILKSGQQASNLVRQLLAFSRRQVIEPQVLDLKTTFTNLNMMLKRIIGEDISFAMIFAPDLWRVKIDPTQIEQIIINLVINARDAMPNGGQLIVNTANITIKEGQLPNPVEMQPGKYVILTVQDTGHGMNDKVKKRIFDPFFTTKNQGEGSGLGLATVYGIVKQNGGSILVDSIEGVGTTFKIYLPQVEAVEISQIPPKAETEFPQGNETILLVEDEAMIRSLILRILHLQGYKLLEAKNGQEALQLASEHLGKIDLLLTDVVMPGLNGKDITQQLLRLYPALKVLYISGYPEDIIAKHGLIDAAITLLSKPFSPISLAQKVRTILDA